MEIKFRGISQSTGKFVYGWFKICGDEYCIHNKNESHYIVKDTLGQFTGKQDIDDDDVYVDDIIGDEVGIYLVCWDEFYASFILKQKGGGFYFFHNSLYILRRSKIIGNIRQNSKLLNDWEESNG